MIFKQNLFFSDFPIDSRFSHRNTKTIQKLKMVRPLQHHENYPKINDSALHKAPWTLSKNSDSAPPTTTWKLSQKYRWCAPYTHPNCVFRKQKKEECLHVKNKFKFSVFKWWLSCTCASLFFNGTERHAPQRLWKNLGRKSLRRTLKESWMNPGRTLTEPPTHISQLCVSQKKKNIIM